MKGVRGNLDVETLLKIVLGLIALVFAIQVLGWLVGFLTSLARIVTPILVAVVLILIILYLLDEI